MKAVRALKSAGGDVELRMTNDELRMKDVSSSKDAVPDASASPKKVAPPSIDSLPPLPEELAGEGNRKEEMGISGAESATTQPKKVLNRQDILNDPKLNAILAVLPGALISDIKGPK